MWDNTISPCGRLISQTWRDDSEADKEFIDITRVGELEPYELENIHDTACHHSSIDKIQQFQYVAQYLNRGDTEIVLPNWITQVQPVVQLGSNLGMRIFIHYGYAPVIGSDDREPVWIPPEITAGYDDELPDPTPEPAGVLAVFGPYKRIVFQENIPLENFMFSLTSVDIRDRVPDDWNWAFSVKGTTRLFPAFNIQMVDGEPIKSKPKFAASHKHTMYIARDESVVFHKQVEFYLQREHVRYMRNGDIFVALPLVKLEGKCLKVPPMILTVGDPFMPKSRSML